MKNKRIIIALPIVLLLLIVAVIAFFFASSSYTDQFSSLELYEQVKGSITTEGGTKILDDDVILEFNDLETSYLVDYIIVKANNTKNINEIGIFKVQGGEANSVKQSIVHYLEGKQQMYRAMDYFPEEVEKIDCAKVVVYGNYVIYSFLNEADSSAFYTAIENLIKK